MNSNFSKGALPPETPYKSPLPYGRTFKHGYKRSLSRKISKRIKIPRCNLLQTKTIQIDEWKQVNVSTLFDSSVQFHTRSFFIRKSLFCLSLNFLTVSRN